MSDLRLTPPQRTQASSNEKDREFYAALDKANDAQLIRSPYQALLELREAYSTLNGKGVSFSDPEKKRLNEFMARLFSVLAERTVGPDDPMDQFSGIREWVNRWSGNPPIVDQGKYNW
jgi:hypothetical protein